MQVKITKWVHEATLGETANNHKQRKFRSSCETERKIENDISLKWLRT
jgi:hypothetical protein